MSRSHRRTSIVGMTKAGSEKADKCIAAGRMRCLYRMVLRRAAGGELVAPDWRAVGHGSWLFAKYGRG